MDTQTLETLPFPPEVLGGVALAVVLLVVGFAVWRGRETPSLEASDDPDALAEAPTMPARDVGRPQPKPAGASFFAGLARTREAFSGTLARLLGGESLDEDMLEELEETLITADVGVRTAAPTRGAPRFRWRCGSGSCGRIAGGSGRASHTAA